MPSLHLSHGLSLSPLCVQERRKKTEMKQERREEMKEGTWTEIKKREKRFGGIFGKAEKAKWA
jgi:hypothetical protein